LRSRPGGSEAQAADDSKKIEGVKHGLHRWQQGYRLQELINECGHLQSCLVGELAKIAAEHPEFEAKTLMEANRQIMDLINEMISESAGQYERMQQAESAGHADDLMGALASLSWNAAALPSFTRPSTTSTAMSSASASRRTSSARPMWSRPIARNSRPSCSRESRVSRLCWES
jgi:hypothetical protein